MSERTDAWILGVELPRSAAARQRLRDALTALWEAQHGELSDVAADLGKLAVFFSPVKSGQTVRAALSSIGQLPLADKAPPAPLVEQATDHLLLVTPEGRVAIELLADIDSSVLHELAAFYRQVSRHRLRQVVAVMTGTGRPAQAPAVGVLVLLLMCGNVGPRRALPRDSDDEGAVGRVIESFADVIAPSKRRAAGAAPRRRGSWQLGELTRRADSVTRNKQSVYINSGEQRRAVDEAGLLLARRPKLTTERLAEALDALDSALDREGALLARVGIQVRDANARRRLRGQLLHAFASAR